MQLLLALLIADWTKNKKLKRVQRIINSLHLPSDCGSLAENCLSDLTTLKGAELRILFFAVVPALMREELVSDGVLRHIVLTYVRALRIVDSPTISHPEIDEADGLLKSFVELFVGRYGREAATANMHMLSHIARVLRDFGPINQTSALPLERSMRDTIDANTNGKNIPTQLMRAWIGKQICMSPDLWLDSKTLDGDIADIHGKIMPKDSPSADDVLGIAVGFALFHVCL